MIVDFFKAAVQDRKPTVKTNQLKCGPFLQDELVLLVTRIKNDYHIIDFHASRPDKSGQCKTLYGEFEWKKGFPYIDVGHKQPLEVVEIVKYSNQQQRNEFIKQIQQKYGDKMFGYIEPNAEVKELTAPSPIKLDFCEKNAEPAFRPEYSNDHHIHIILGGYLDRNHRLLDTKELHKRIRAKDEEIAALKNIILNQNDEGAKQSARDVWYTKFHDIVKEEHLSPLQYKKINEFMFSEYDR